MLYSTLRIFKRVKPKKNHFNNLQIKSKPSKFSHKNHEFLLHWNFFIIIQKYSISISILRYFYLQHPFTNQTETTSMMKHNGISLYLAHKWFIINLTLKIVFSIQWVWFWEKFESLWFVYTARISTGKYCITCLPLGIRKWLSQYNWGKLNYISLLTNSCH